MAGSGIGKTMAKEYFVYILTDDRNKRFYTGLTDELIRRNAEGINMAGMKVSPKNMAFINWYTTKLMIYTKLLQNESN
jgi:predicted GIY-YIG superfamily endonuclease